MNSNDNDAMEWNDVLSETNIFICYMHESELRMQSYDMMNMSKKIRDLGKKSPRVYCSSRFRSGSHASRGVNALFTGDGQGGDRQP